MLAGIQSVFLLTSNGYACFSGTPSTEEYQSDATSLITVSLDKVFNELLKEVKVSFKVKAQSIVDVLIEGMERESEQKLTKQERDLLQIVRDDGYSSIKVEKKDGKKWLVHAGKVQYPTQLTALELSRIIAEREYGKIEITKAGGAVVHITAQDDYQLTK
jgi:hypothetical protein